MNELSSSILGIHMPSKRVRCWEEMLVENSNITGTAYVPDKPTVVLPSLTKILCKRTNAMTMIPISMQLSAKARHINPAHDVPPETSLQIDQ